MYIQHAPSEITKNHIYVSILHWPSITDCWHRHTQTSHKVKTVFQYARGYIYSGRCCQDKTKKHANKYTGKIHDVQINIVQQRISKTKNCDLTFLLRGITPICVASTSVSAISQTPWNSAWGLLRSWHDVLPEQNPAWQAQTDTAVSLWVSRAKYQFRLRNSSWPFCSDSPEWRSRNMVTWFWRHGDAFGTTENAFFLFFSFFVHL